MSSTRELQVDLCIIGAGAAGLSVAAGAAQLGLSVVLFEAGEMGGDCLNYGCVPSKALIAAANLAHKARNGADLGLDTTGVSIDWPRVKAHLKGAIANQDFEALVATVEAHLAEAPNDIEGWKVLAPAYKRERRWGDAADAYANVLRLAPPTADAIADYGEMLVFANEGMVTDEAEGAFVEALKLEATNERAKFYYDMALKQEGKAPALSDEQIAAVQAMPAQDQTAMIAGMMDGLEQKLGNDSRDLEGWKRLIRARRVSNEIDKAKISLDLAMNIFKDEPATLDALRDLAKELGIAE